MRCRRAALVVASLVTTARAFFNTEKYAAFDDVKGVAGSSGVTLRLGDARLTTGLLAADAPWAPLLHVGLILASAAFFQATVGR